MTISGKSGHVRIKGNLYANNRRADILLQNFYNSRPTSANITPDGSGGLYKFVATSSMTTGKPRNDAHIVNLSWDNAYGWDSQIAVGNGTNPFMQVRTMNGNEGWQSWHDISVSKVLYNNASGTNGTVTLSETAANFSYLEIFFKDNVNNKYYSAKLQSPNGKSTSLSYIESFNQSNQNTNSFYLFSRQITINATSISTDTGHYGLVNVSGNTVLYQNRFNITKVLGYK